MQTKVYEFAGVTTTIVYEIIEKALKSDSQNNYFAQFKINSLTYQSSEGEFQIDLVDNSLYSINGELVQILEGQYTDSTDYENSVPNNSGLFKNGDMSMIYLKDNNPITVLTDASTYVPYNSDGTLSLDINFGIIQGDESNLFKELTPLKSSKVKVSGSWKDSFSWIKKNGSWKRCIVWKKISGTWKKGNLK